MKSLRLRSKTSSFLRSSDGGILVLSTLLLPIFLGFMALAIDVGLWYQSKRHLQLLADSLAMGGAYALKNGSNVVTYVTHDAGLNGFAATNGRTLTINTPPTSGTYNGNSKAVEVILTAPSNRYFTASYFPNSFSISARAVGLMGNSGSVYANSCLSVLDKTGTGALTVSGASQVAFTQCGSYVNSSSSTAMSLAGGAVFTASDLSIVGNYSISGTSKLLVTNSVVTGTSPVADPYAGVIPTPSFSGCNHTNFTTSGTVTINPGVYCNGITLDGTDNVTMSPGVYIIDRGTLSLSRSAVLQGTGVTLFLTSSTGSNYANINAGGNSILSLTPPSSGTYANVVAFSPPQAAVTHQVSGGSSLRVSGLVYFPNSTTTFSGGTSVNACIRLVANRASFTNGAIFTGTCAGGISSSQVTQLVE